MSLRTRLASLDRGDRLALVALAVGLLVAGGGGFGFWWAGFDGYAAVSVFFGDLLVLVAVLRFGPRWAVGGDADESP